MGLADELADFSAVRPRAFELATRDRTIRAARGTVDPRHPCAGGSPMRYARPRTMSLPSRAGSGAPADHIEGVKATAERRLGGFKGR